MTALFHMLEKFMSANLIIKLVMLVFILLLLATSWYMWHRRRGDFLIYDISGRPELSEVLKWTAIALFLESILGIGLLFSSNRYLNLITIGLACLTLLIFSLLFNEKN